MVQKDDFEENVNWRKTIRELSQRPISKILIVEDQDDIFKSVETTITNNLLRQAQSTQIQDPSIFLQDQSHKDCDAYSNQLYQKKPTQMELQALNSDEPPSVGQQPNHPNSEIVDLTEEENYYGRQESPPSTALHQPPSPEEEDVTKTASRGRQATGTKKRSEKNIIGYITKQSIVWVLKKYPYKLKLALRNHYCNNFKKETHYSQCRDCKKADSEFNQLIAYYQEVRKEMYGPEKLAEMLRVRAEEGEAVKLRKKIFYGYFQRVLRRDYLLYFLKSGKMSDKQAYISMKNQYLLYFLEHVAAQDKS